MKLRNPRLNSILTQLLEEGSVVVVPGNSSRGADDSHSTTIGVLPPHIPPVPPRPHVRPGPFRKGIINRYVVPPKGNMQVVDIVHVVGIRGEEFEIGITKKGLRKRNQIKRIASLALRNKRL